MAHEERTHQEPTSRMENKALVKWSSRGGIHRDVFGRGSKEAYEPGASVD